MPKRVTTAPLTSEELEQTLVDFSPDEVLERFDEIFSRDLDLPESLEELLSLDDYVDSELRDMFQSIIAQYMRPIEFAIEQIRAGEATRRTAEEAFEALRPIREASETMEYEDITRILVRIEQPLSDLANGAKRKLIKRDLNDLNEAWNQLGVLLKTEAERDAATPALLSLGGLPRYLDGVTTAQVRSLRAAGISSLNDLADAPVEDIMAVAGLPKATAERIRAFSAGSVSVAAAESRRNASTKLPEGWMRLDIESDLFRGRLTFEYSTIAKYLEPILAKLAENDVKAPKPAPKSKALATPSRTPAKRAAKKRTT
ncbi:MAG: helix-hairpin-helix domain-containing protein [Blastocatellia bacterium]|nr:helix-hairpin-helix domain-containing protein [Blastocatellia bacterium]